MHYYPVIITLFFLSGCARFFLADREYPDSFTTGQEIIPPIKLLWEKKTPGLPGGGLVFHEGYILMACGTGHVAAMEMDTGELTAKKKFGKSCAVPPIIKDSVLYQSYEMGDEGLIAYNFKKKKFIWKLENNLSQSAPLQFDNNIYHQSLDGNLLCLESKTGQIRWQYSMNQRALNALCIKENHIISAGLDGRIVALEASNGNELWRMELSSNILADPVINENLLYISGYNGTLYALSINDGSILNQKKFAVHLYYPPAFDENNIYLSLSSGTLVAASIKDFKPIWTFDGSGPAADAPLVTSSYIYYTTLGNRLYVLDKTMGRVLQTIRLKGRPRSKPYIIYNHLYVVYENKYVTAFIQEN